jgi:hypothetical protein
MRKAPLTLLLTWATVAGFATAAGLDEADEKWAADAGVVRGSGERAFGDDDAPEPEPEVDAQDYAPEPEPHHSPAACEPALLEQQAMEQEEMELGLALGKPPPPPHKPPPPPPLGPPCRTFLNETHCPDRCFWYPHHKLCRTVAYPQPPCDCPQWQHCTGHPENTKNCNAHNTCPEYCVWNRAQKKCSLIKLPPPAGQIDTSDKGAVGLIGIFVLILVGIGVIIGFMIRWVEQQEVKARMMALPSMQPAIDEVVAPLNEDTIDEGGEREYRRAGGEYMRGRALGDE